LAAVRIDARLADASTEVHAEEIGRLGTSGRQHHGESEGEDAGNAWERAGAPQG
jgi:hypothetical protein